jgi:uncharacterized protein (TIGR02246 family)
MASTETRATSPQHVFEQISRHVNAGDLEALLGLYEPEAAFVPRPGVVIDGLEAIRGALERILATNPTMSGEVQRVVGTNEVALVFNRWRLEGARSDGSPVEMSGLSADVVRRQPDDSWRVLIDDPWGGETSPSDGTSWRT